MSDVQDDGYLRVHRHTPGPAFALAAQFLVGQPVLIRTSDGRFVPGVTATPSTHLSGFRSADDRARVQTLDDIWIDVGASSRDQVTALGIRILDPVTLRERAVSIGDGRVAGIAVSFRAAATAVLEAVRRQGEVTAPRAPGGVSIAWVGQSQFGHRGLVRLLETMKPDRVVVLRGGVAPGDDARGSVGEVGRGPVIADGDTWLSERAAAAGVAVQTVPAARMAVNPGDAYKAIPMHVVSVPVQFAQTPVETADGRDVEALARLVAALAGYGPLRADDSDAGDMPDPAPVAVPALARPNDAAALAAAHVRSGGGAVRRLGSRGPGARRGSEAAAAVGEAGGRRKGNVRVTFGAGPRPLVFVAHMDEVGFEIARIADDGALSVRARGGMYLSVYEAHPVLVHTPKGPLGAVLAPRRGYATAKAAQPAIDDLSCLSAPPARPRPRRSAWPSGRARPSGSASCRWPARAARAARWTIATDRPRSCWRCSRSIPRSSPTT